MAPHEEGTSYWVGRSDIAQWKAELSSWHVIMQSCNLISQMPLTNHGALSKIFGCLADGPFCEGEGPSIQRFVNEFATVGRIGADVERANRFFKVDVECIQFSMVRGTSTGIPQS